MPSVGEITLERMTDTRKLSKTLKLLKSKFPTRPYKHYFQYIVQYVMGRFCLRDKEITTLRKNYETGTFRASSL